MAKRIKLTRKTRFEVFKRDSFAYLDEHEDSDA